MSENERRVFGRCACCDNCATDDGSEFYVAEDGEVFCSIDCVLEYYGVVKAEV